MLFKKNPPPKRVIFRPNPPSEKEPKGNFLTSFCLLIIFCVCVWIILESVSPHQPVLSEPPRFYSNQTQQDLRLTLVDAIRKSKCSIHLVMFGLSDPAILSALARKEIPVAVYYDPNASPNLWSSLPNAGLHPVRSYGLMHQKILILDNETIFIGSANMTTASLTMHDNLVVGMKSAKIAQFLIEKTPYSSGYLRAMTGGQDIELWLLPDPRGHALHDIKRKIRSAQRSLRIALFTFTHPILVEELIAAHVRGVDISLIIDLHSGLGASSHAIEKLKKAGIKVYMSKGVQLLHHKFIIIDNQTLLMGSANWTKAAFYSNSDCILILHQLNEEQNKFMDRLWNRIEAEARLLKVKQRKTAKSFL